jgi:hypothetical protein
MKRHFDTAIRTAARLYVPYPVLFETANAIAHIQEDLLRQSLAAAFTDTVLRSLEQGEPWIITPTDRRAPMLVRDELLKLCQSFERSYAHQRMGLTDAFIVHEAERLKGKHSADGRHVHIWTADSALGRHAPDRLGPGCPGA